MAVSLSIFCAASGSLVAAVYAAFCLYLPPSPRPKVTHAYLTDGRRAAYLVGTPLLFLGSMGVAFSRSVPEMMVFRCVQALGTSGGMSVGGAIIGDIYKLTERGTAMGVFFGVRLFPEQNIPRTLTLHRRPVCLDLRSHHSSEVRCLSSAENVRSAD